MINVVLITLRRRTCFRTEESDLNVCCCAFLNTFNLGINILKIRKLKSVGGTRSTIPVEAITVETIAVETITVEVIAVEAIAVEMIAVEVIASCADPGGGQLTIAVEVIAV